MGLSEFLASCLGGARASRKSKVAVRRQSRRLSIEPLESRTLLAAAGLVDVGAQPDGGLSGKITYIHGGHGYTTYMGPTPDRWAFQRPALLGMVEDLGNQEQMTALADYLFRAGATVVPMRPVGHQPSEVVLDNAAAGVTFSGAWSNSSSSVYFGSAGDVPYRFATTALTETAYARYRPTVTTAGFYPVYAWTLAGSDRAADQLYRVNHSGGITEVTVNHRRVGGGLVYLGTYHFEAGTSGYVDVSNRSSVAGNVAIADMIRFGNGMGDIDRGQGISGKTREDEPALYWIKWHVDRSQGIADSEYYSDTLVNDEDRTVAASPRYSEFMNRQQDGVLSDRLLVSFHSNAGGGRGVTALHNTSHGGTTPNQVFLAQTLATEVNNDLVAQNGQFEHNWFNRGSNILYEHPDFNYGELNNSWINGEFDATIVEVAFHDSQLDAELMRDADVRDALARATYQGMVKYFCGVDGNATPLSMLPGKVAQVRARTVGAGSVELTWTPPAANAYNGDAATGYRIYGSTNGYGFDGGTFVAGGGAASFTMNDLDPSKVYFFKVVAMNAGGEGAGSEVVAANPVASTAKVLIVNGFDRQDRSQNPTQAVSSVTIERVRPRYSNSYDYAAQMATALHAQAPELAVDTTSNEFVASGAVNLADYSAVFWILGEESTAGDTFNATEQTMVTAYLAAGGKLFLSGSEIGFDLDNQAGGAAFYNNQLRADFVADDANSYSAAGAAGSIFAGLNLTFDNGAQFYDVNSPDRINPLGGATAALTYSTGGAAGIQYADPGNGSKVVMLAFPFETITTAANRGLVMDRVIDFFALNEASTGDFDDDGRVDGADFLAWQRGVGKAAPTLADGDADGDGDVDGADLGVWREQFGVETSAGVSASAPASVAGATAPAPASSSARASIASAFSAAARDKHRRQAFGATFPAAPRRQDADDRPDERPVRSRIRFATAPSAAGDESLDAALESLNWWSWRDGAG